MLLISPTSKLQVAHHPFSFLLTIFSSLLTILLPLHSPIPHTNHALNSSLRQSPLKRTPLNIKPLLIITMSKKTSTPKADSADTSGVRHTLPTH
jgi:hypothetical protein